MKNDLAANGQQTGCKEKDEGKIRASLLTLSFVKTAHMLHSSWLQH